MTNQDHFDAALAAAHELSDGYLTPKTKGGVVHYWALHIKALLNGGR